MANNSTKVRTLADFARKVKTFRRSWHLDPIKELWFRGESRQYPTYLRPELYRPHSGEETIDVDKALETEVDLYDIFQRSAVQLSPEKKEDENWDWDSYYLMQQHGAPTRLLDWTDGALMALHFAVRNRKDDKCDAVVYVLEPYRLSKGLDKLLNPKRYDKLWRTYVKKHPSYGYSDDEWQSLYLPFDKDTRKELGPIPGPPLLLNLPHITRRVAAQRSQFMVFGTDAVWLANEFDKHARSTRKITIDAKCRREIRLELRDCGITESVIFPDLDGLGREIKQLWEDRR